MKSHDIIQWCYYVSAEPQSVDTLCVECIEINGWGGSANCIRTVTKESPSLLPARRGSGKCLTIKHLYYCLSLVTPVLYNICFTKILWALHEFITDSSRPEVERKHQGTGASISYSKRLKKQHQKRCPIYIWMKEMINTTCLKLQTLYVIFLDADYKIHYIISIQVNITLSKRSNKFKSFKIVLYLLVSRPTSTYMYLRNLFEIK